MSKQDTDKLELAVEGINGVIRAGEKIMSDGKVDFADSIHVPELFDAVKKLVEAAKSAKELIEESKDLDGAEAIKLVGKMFK